jgi:hypothetical protein
MVLIIVYLENILKGKYICTPPLRITGC